MNPQSVNGTDQLIYCTYNEAVKIILNASNNLYFVIPTGTGNGQTGVGTSYSLSVNTWYYVTYIFQSNGSCSFYVNNSLVGTCTNSGGFGSFTSSGIFSLGVFDTGPYAAFHGSIADLRIHNSAIPYVPLPHLSPAYWLPFEGSAADAGSYSMVSTATPHIYLPFEGSTADVYGHSTVTTPGGAVSYVPSGAKGVTGTQALNLVNTAGGTADRYVRGTWTGSANFTVSFWMNLQSSGAIQTIFSTLGGACIIQTYGANNQLVVYMPSGGSTNTTNIAITPTYISQNTWNYFTFIFQTNGLCSFYMNNNLLYTGTNSQGVGSYTWSQFSIGTYDTNQANAFNGLIDDFKLYNTAFVNTPSPVPEPTIYLPMEGSVADQQGFSTVTTSPTVPGYTTSVRAGALGTRAINLVNTAGGTADRYVRGTWTGSPSGNFTVSFWFNAQNVTTGQYVLSGYQGVLAITISPGYINAIIPSGGGTNYAVVGSLSGITANTWYFVSLIFQTNGLCSFYVNQSLIGSVTNTQGVGTTTSNVIQLGGFDTAVSLAFNGYIDDFKIYNYAVSLQHPSIYLPFEGSVADAMGGSAVSTSPTVPGYTASVPLGSTGIRSLNLVNGAGGAAQQYVRGTWNGSANFTVSFWFNAQSLTSVTQIMFSTYYGQFVLYIDASNQLSYFMYPGVVVAASSPLTANTWYYTTAIFQTNGTCSLYLNNALVGTRTNTGGLGASTVAFGLGTYDSTESAAFNGYINDLRLWNSAIPYTPVSVVTPTGTLSYVPGAVGQTAVNLVNTAGGLPSNYATLSVSLSTTPAITFSGWFNALSFASNEAVVCSFGQNNTNVNVAGVFLDLAIYGNPGQVKLIYYNSSNSWININGPIITTNSWYHFYVIYQPSGTVSMYINGVLYTGVGYTLASTSNICNLGCFPYTGYAGAFNGYIDDFRLYNSAIPYSSLVPNNYTHLAMAGNGAYRMAAHQLGSQSGRLLLSSDSGASWTPQTAAATPGLWSSLSASNSGQYLTAQSQAVVQPNQSGLVTSTWSQQGVTYTVSASSSLGGYDPYKAFNNNFSDPGTTSWATNGGYDANGDYVGSVSTTISGIGAVLGEWLQLQVSIPMVLQSYRYASNNANQLPRKGYIVGSNDGTTWYPLQYVSMMTNPLINVAKVYSSSVLVNYTGTQTIQGEVVGSGVTTAYATSTTPFIYFRFIANTVWGAGAGGYYAFGELYPNFLGGSITPNQSGLASSTWLNSGVSWGASASSLLIGTLQAYGAFNNVYTAVGNYSWASAQTYTSGTGFYAGAVSTTVQGGVGAVLGEWLQLQSSVPVVLQSYTYGCGNYLSLPKVYYIVGSNDGSTWYPLQYVSMASNPLSFNFSTCSTYLIMNYTGTQTLSGSSIVNAATTAYSPYVNQAFQYFRIIATSVYPGTQIYEFLEFLPIFSAGQNSSTNYGLTWTPSIQTGDAFNVTKNLTVLSSGTGWAQLPAFTPVATGVTFSAWVTLISAPVDLSTLFDAGITNSNPTSTIKAYFQLDRRVVFFQRVSGVNTGVVVTTTPCTIGTECHLVYTIDGSGNHRAYFNGVQDGTTDTGAINIVTYPYFYIGKSNFTGETPTNMTVRDFRMFNRALNAAEVAALYANVNYGQPAVGPLALSDSGEYALAAFDRCAEVGSGYLTGVQNTRWSNPLLSGISGPIVDTAVSQTGREMVLVTASGLNNVYYSTDYGATFTGLGIGQSALPSGSLPLARLSLDNTNVDVQRSLTPATGAGSVTYSTSIVKVGLSSALFSNTAGSTTPANYLNYTMPAVLNQPSVLSIGGWFYITTLPGSGISVPFCFNNGSTVGGLGLFFASFQNNILQFSYTTTGSGYQELTNNVSAVPNTWYHVMCVFNAGVSQLYINGSLSASGSYTGNLCLSGGGNLTNLFVGAQFSSGTYAGAFAGHIDDVRLYNTALSAADVLALYNNAPALANDQSSAMVACSISNDGSYLSVTNSAGGVYELNKNSNTYTLAIGNQAGAVNQGSNAIAIGNGAGQVNQSANSIVLNASGSALNPSSSGFYVAPIGTTSGLPMDLLGYGADSQVVKTGISVLPGGATRIQNAIELSTSGSGVSNTNALGSLNFVSADSFSTSTIASIAAHGTYAGPGAQFGSTLRFSTYSWSVAPTGLIERMRISDVGNVGIGTTNPGTNLTIYGKGQSSFPAISITSDQSTRGLTLFHVSAAGSGVSGSQLGDGVITVESGTVGDGSKLYLCRTSAFNPVMTVVNTGNVGIGTTNPGATLDVNGVIKGSLFATINTSVFAGSSQNTYTLTVPYPGSYLFTVMSTGVTINNAPADNYAKGMFYVVISPNGTLILTSIITSVGVWVNSYTTSTQDLSYNIGTTSNGQGIQTVLSGGYANVSIMRLA
jgi:hypothetical protein